MIGSGKITLASRTRWLPRGPAPERPRGTGRGGGVGRQGDARRGHNKTGRIATTVEGMNPLEEGSDLHLTLHLQVVVEAHPCQRSQKRSSPSKRARQVTPSQALSLRLRLINQKAGPHPLLAVRNLLRIRSFMTINRPLRQKRIFSTGLKSRVHPAIEAGEVEHGVAPHGSSALDLMSID